MSEILGQRVLPQANVLLGFSNYYIHAKGCLITELAECIGVSVEEVNDKLKNVAGFAADATGQVSLVIWAKIAEAFPGITVERFWAYNNDDVLAKLAEGKSVIVEVSATPIGGTGSHFVRYIGDGKLHDPWTGTERPTSDFPDVKGYAVVSGKFVEPVAEVTPAAPVAPVENTYQGLDLTNLDSVKAAIDTWHDVANGLYVKADEYVTFKNKIAEALGVDGGTNIDDLVAHIVTLKNQAPATPVVPDATPDITMKNLPSHEKESLMNRIAAIETEFKHLLGLE